MFVRVCVRVCGGYIFTIPGVLNLSILVRSRKRNVETRILPRLQQRAPGSLPHEHSRAYAQQNGRSDLSPLGDSTSSSILYCAALVKTIGYRDRWTRRKERPDLRCEKNIYTVSGHSLFRTPPPPPPPHPAGVGWQWRCTICHPPPKLVNQVTVSLFSCLFLFVSLLSEAQHHT